MSDKESVSANLIARLADEAAQIYRRQRKAGVTRPNMRECLSQVMKLHNLDKLSETLVSTCLSEMGRILGRRGGRVTKRNNQLRQEGILPPLEKSVSAQKPTPRPLRFSEFLPFKTGNVWHSPLGA